jgi:DNA-binding transcriptional MerR regulator
MQIGEVAERTGLSLRTIRHYEQMGLVRPSARTSGGFRLYTDADVARLLLVKRMKPLEFSLDEIQRLLAVLDALAATGDGPATRDELLDRLEMFSTAAETRCDRLREQLADAEHLAADLHREIALHRRGVHPTR